MKRLISDRAIELTVMKLQDGLKDGDVIFEKIYPNKFTYSFSGNTEDINVGQLFSMDELKEFLTGGFILTNGVTYYQDVISKQYTQANATNSVASRLFNVWDLNYDIPSTQTLQSINIGSSFGLRCQVYYTKDGGTSWTEMPTSTTGGVNLHLTLVPISDTNPIYDKGPGLYCVIKVTKTTSSSGNIPDVNGFRIKVRNFSQVREYYRINRTAKFMLGIRKYNEIDKLLFANDPLSKNITFTSTSANNPVFTPATIPVSYENRVVDLAVSVDSGKTISAIAVSTDGLTSLAITDLVINGNEATFKLQVPSKLSGTVKFNVTSA